jgi:ABC-type uncharacterized transport system auxiliary subunit
MNENGSRPCEAARIWISLTAALLICACAQQPTVQQTANVQSQQAANMQSRQAASTQPSELEIVELAVQPASDAGDEVVCREETQVGTHFPRRRCFSRRRLEDIRRNAQDWLRSGGFEGAPTAVR